MRKITREEAVKLVQKYDLEFPIKYYKEFLDYIDLTDKEFHEIVDKFRSPHFLQKLDGNWQLRTSLKNI